MLDRENIKKDIPVAHEIIEKRPELLKMSEEEILKVFETGIRADLHIRWVVAALICVSALVEDNIKNITDKLLEAKHKELTCEYIGFILQEDYQISLLELLIEASRLGKSEQILPYIIAHISYEKSSLIEKIEDILTIIETEINQEKQYLFFMGYANLLITHGQDSEVFKTFIKTNASRYGGIIRHIGLTRRRRGELSLVDIMAKELLNIDNRTALNCGIELLEMSIQQYEKTFEEYFPYLEDKMLKHDMDTSKLIPIYVSYVENFLSGRYQHIIVNKLMQIAGATTEKKIIFVREIEYRERVSEQIESILRRILDTSFDKNPVMLQALDHFYYGKIHDGEDEDAVLEQLSDIYKNNRYTLAEHFWEHFGCVSNCLRAKQEIVWRRVLGDLLYGDVSDFCFGIQLMKDIMDVSFAKDFFNRNSYQDLEKKFLLQVAIYYWLEPKKICSLAFDMCDTLMETEEYFKVCEEELFENYPGTVSKYAKENENSENGNVAELAKRLIVLEAQELEIRKIGAEIVDLRPSSDMVYAHRRAIMEQNTRISKDAERRSVFGSLFPKRIMKYGKRNAFVQSGYQGNFSFQVNEYGRLEYQIELPRLYSENPMEWRMKRDDCLRGRGRT